MITEIILTDISGDFALDSKSVTLEWLIVSDELNDFPVQIAIQGTVDEMIDGNGKAQGWLAPGSSYVLGNDQWLSAFADTVQISERKVIRGTGQMEITINNGNIVPVFPTPSGIVLWKATQKYSTRAQEKSGETPGVNDKFTLKTSVELEDMPFERDARTQKLIQNSAGCFFDPLPTSKRKIKVYQLTRREYGNPMTKANAYSNVVNSDNFYGSDPGMMLMESITCDFDGEAWTVTYTMKERQHGWETFLLDTGYEELIDGKLYKIVTDGDETPPSAPVKLDGDGQKLENQDDEGYDLGPFWKYKELPFTALFIPNFYNINSRG